MVQLSKLSYDLSNKAETALLEERGMSIEGIWTGEVYSAFGWENRGVWLLENGRIVMEDTCENRQPKPGSLSTISNDILRITIGSY